MGGSEGPLSVRDRGWTFLPSEVESREGRASRVGNVGFEERRTRIGLPFSQKGRWKGRDPGSGTTTDTHPTVRGRRRFRDRSEQECLRVGRPLVPRDPDP